MANRVKFDFEIYFSKLGSLKGQDYRMDIATNSISDEQLKILLVSELRLLQVDTVIIRDKVIINEVHQRGASGFQYIDLSHQIENGLITYRGLPAPIICDYLSREDSSHIYEEGTRFQIGKIEMVGNTGTYIDSPFHRFEHGKDLSQLTLEKLADLTGIVIHAPYEANLEINEKYFYNLDLRNKAVLIHTGWARHWNTEKYYTEHPFLTKSAAEYLKEQEVLLVGIDSHNIDDTRGNARPVHTTLLGSEILIVEHLCHLDLLPTSDFYFSAVPPKFLGMGTFPVRAFAKIKSVS